MSAPPAECVPIPKLAASKPSQNKIPPAPPGLDEMQPMHQPKASQSKTNKISFAQKDAAVSPRAKNGAGDGGGLALPNDGAGLQRKKSYKSDKSKKSGGSRKRKKKEPRFAGVVKSYGAENGWGFITCEDLKEFYEVNEIFVHKRDLNDFDPQDHLRPGTQVTFSVLIQPTGRLRAQKVDIGEAPEIKPPKMDLFIPHVSEEEAELGLKEKRYFMGLLRAHPTQTMKAWVTIHGQPPVELLIYGREARNRSYHGDTVVVEIIDEDEEDDEEGGESEDEIVQGGVLGEKEEKEDPTNVESPRALLKIESEHQLARVVFIKEYAGRNKGFVCTIKPMREDQDELTAADKMIKAVPVVQKYSWILLQLNDETKEILNIPGKIDFKQQYFVKIMQWNEKSYLPLGKIEGPALGRCGTVAGEINACMHEHGLSEHSNEFSEEIEDEVDEVVDRVMQNFEQECAAREDIRKTKRVFTIDPATAKDLDDAIHVEVIEGNILEVGVHIADVGTFVYPSTALDDQAQFRTTSVYMPDRVMPMLPHQLCNNLCSLNPNEDKLTFSAFYRIDMSNGKTYWTGKHKPRFAKTVIKSCCRLNYEEAQQILDGTDVEDGLILPVSCGWTWDQIKEDCLQIYAVTQKTRAFRLREGGLTLRKTKMIFKTRGSADGLPRQYYTESHSWSHKIIEELMLLANQSVARFMANSPLAEVSCLRNHEAPDQKKQQDMARIMSDCGVKWDARSSKTVFNSLRAAEEKYGEFITRTFEILVMRSGMKPAKYYLHNSLDENGDEQSPYHYALDFEYYTHFTSPIRRYPDVLVHRTLWAILQKKSQKELLDSYADPSKKTEGGGEEGENDECDKQEQQEAAGEQDYDWEDDYAQYEAEYDEIHEGEWEEKYREEKKRLDAKRKALGGHPMYTKLNHLCKKSNEKKRAAKEASEMCDRAFFCMYLKGLGKLWYSNVSLIGVDPKMNYILVYSHQIGKEKKIEFKKGDLARKDLAKKNEIQLPYKVKPYNQYHIKFYWRHPDEQARLDEERRKKQEAEDALNELPVDEAGNTILPSVPAPGEEGENGDEPRRRARAPEEKDDDHDDDDDDEDYGTDGSSDGEGDEEEERLENSGKIVSRSVYIFGELPIALIPLDTAPIDFTMMLLSPFHPEYAALEAGWSKMGDGFKCAAPHEGAQSEYDLAEGCDASDVDIE